MVAIVTSLVSGMQEGARPPPSISVVHHRIARGAGGGMYVLRSTVVIGSGVNISSNEASNGGERAGPFAGALDWRRSFPEGRGRASIKQAMSRLDGGRPSFSHDVRSSSYGVEMLGIGRRWKTRSVTRRSDEPLLL